jgi:single-strand DNA-binding protein
MNHITLHGFVGKNPEGRTLGSGKKVAKFTFATSESYKDSQGERKENTSWHSIVVWDKLADICEKYVKKGSELILEGKVTYGDYTDKEGVKKYFTEIVCNSISFCGKKKSEPAPENNEGKFQKNGKVSQEPLPDTRDTDNDLPFS